MTEDDTFKKLAQLPWDQLRKKIGNEEPTEEFLNQYHWTLREYITWRDLENEILKNEWIECLTNCQQIKNTIIL